MRKTTHILTLLFGIVSARCINAQSNSPWQYQTNQDHTITITGFTGLGGAVIIPTTINGLQVTAIGERAFAANYSITDVAISEGVLSIGELAFESCYNLTNAPIPSTVTNIGRGPFAECLSLTSISVDTNNNNYIIIGEALCDRNQTVIIQFPAGSAASTFEIANTFASIGGYAFAGSSLTSVTIPDSMMSIGAYAFYSSSLSAVAIPNGVTNLGDGAFCNTPLQSVVVPPLISDVGDFTFGYCFDLTNLSLPNGVTNIGNSAFFECKKLAGLALPDGIQTIGDNAFASCFVLSNIIIPHGALRLGACAFYGCEYVDTIEVSDTVTNIGDFAFAYSYTTSINVDSNNPAFSSTGGVLFNKSQTELLQVPGFDKLGDYKIPHTVTRIGNGAFFNDKPLNSVTVPSSVVSIGDEAFEGCWGMSAFYFEGNAPTLGSNSFLSVYAGVHYLPGTIGWSNYYGGLQTSAWFLPNPTILNEPPSLGVNSNGFGFTVSWATNAIVSVEASTCLSATNWISITNSALTNGSFYFADPEWTNFPDRFYRLRKN